MRLARFLGAAACAAMGVVMLVAPGPGLLLLAAGAALLASESLAVARLLDWSELRLRRALHAFRR